MTLPRDRRRQETRTDGDAPPAARVRGHDEGAHVSPSWLARAWGVNYETVMRDIRKGALKAYRLPGGQLRIRRTDARKYGRPTE